MTEDWEENVGKRSNLLARQYTSVEEITDPIYTSSSRGTEFG
jgi:hypothetical protein